MALLLISLAAIVAASVHPIDDPIGWITGDDIDFVGESSPDRGDVTIALQVDKDGNPSECSILSSSLSMSYQIATCDLLRKRAHFSPARDDRGNKVAGVFMHTVHWPPPDPYADRGVLIHIEIDATGQIIYCKEQRIGEHGKVPFDCTGFRSLAALEKLVGGRLDQLRAVNIRMAMEVTENSISQPLSQKKDVTFVLSKARIDISPEGVVTGCVPLASMGPDFGICRIVAPAQTGQVDFQPDLSQETRSMTITFAVTGSLQ